MSIKIDVRKPDEKLWEYVALELGDFLPHGYRAECSRETRTSYRVWFEYGPHYTNNGMLDAQTSEHELILHKDRPVLEYTLVNKQPDYIARKHDVKTYLEDNVLYDVLERAAQKAWGYSQLDELQDKAEVHKASWHKSK